MKKRLTLIVLIIVGLTIQTAQAQSKYIDKKGKLTFEASEALFEPVKATNESVTMLLDVDSGEIAALALMKGFRFKNSLMEEHFNENYIESETYPKATFKGKLASFDASALSSSPSEVMVKGVLKLHGEEKAIETALSITKSGDVIEVKGSFNVKPEDFAIEIPKVVRNKIAKEIIISLDFKLSKR